MDDDSDRKGEGWGCVVVAVVFIVAVTTYEIVKLACGGGK